MLIQTLTDEELLRVVRCNNKHIARARRNKDYENLAHYIDDSEHIMREVSNRLPDSFKKEMKTVLDVQPGEWYQHRTNKSLRLQVVDDEEYRGPLFSCRCFVCGIYHNRFIIKQSTLLQQYQKIKI